METFEFCLAMLTRHDAETPSLQPGCDLQTMHVADILSHAHLSSSDSTVADHLLEVMIIQILSSRHTDELRDAVEKDTTC